MLRRIHPSTGWMDNPVSRSRNPLRQGVSALDLGGGLIAQKQQMQALVVIPKNYSTIILPSLYSEVIPSRRCSMYA